MQAPKEGFMYRKLSVVLATLAAAVLASAALAAPEGKPLTGTWSGHTSQDLSLTETEWSVRITVTALGGRLAAIVTSARLECPGPAVKDIRVFESWRAGKGPKLSHAGGFAVKVDGVSVSGGLGPAGASGRFNVSDGGCSGKGTWKAKRVLRG
jgi:hypothetical protein